MDLDKMAEHEIEMVESVKTWNDETLTYRYDMIRNNAEANIRLCLIIAIELDKRGYMQTITWNKSKEEEKEDCLGCGKEYNKKDLMEYRKGHSYCATCIEEDTDEEDECLVDSDGNLVDNDGDAETDMEERR